MRTIQKWKERWKSMLRDWFLNKSWWIHTHSLLLYEISKFSPYSLSKEVIRYVMKWGNELLYFCRILFPRQAGNCRYGDTTFLCQWVSATSSSTCSKPPYLARQDDSRHGELWSSKTWVLELLFPPWWHVSLWRTFIPKNMLYVPPFPPRRHLLLGRHPFFFSSPFYVSFIGSCLDHTFPA